ncbi:MAG TPA: OmpA family protein [Xanthomarina sp.]|nr:OmpA family protein [Xanthomarina sp.]
MKNSITIFSFLILSFSSVSLVYSQEKKIKKATENYAHLNYVNAQKVYLAVADKGHQSEELFTKLANSYYFNAQYDQAVIWYERLFNFVSEPERDLVYLRYSQALKAMGQTDKSLEYYDAFVHKTGFNTNSKTAKDYLGLIQQNSGRYELESLQATYNENKITFGHVKQGDALYYSSTNDSKTFLNKRSAWDGLSFLSLYTIELDTLNRAISKPKKLTGNIESKFHESSPVFTEDGNTMYFTQSNLTYEHKRDDQNLKIYRSKKVGNKWQKPEELSINSDHFSTAHPSLSPDGTKLYFSSDRPGGFGESDLYVSKIDANGNLSEPVNLGSQINTSGKETFPFVSANNELYFSSDGHLGLGGLDVFYVKIRDNDYGNLLNIGAPVNSYADDFSFGMDVETRRGFISSNRSSVEGEFVYDNIYSFLETTPIIDVYKAQIEGFVFDKQTGVPIANATLILKDSEGHQYASLVTNSEGYYQVESNRFEVYTLQVSHERYDSDDTLSESGLETQKINFHLQQNEIALVPGVDLAKVLNIPIIYFDFDKSNIRKDAQVELEKVFTVLQEHDHLRLNIRSHTDSRGNYEYNQSLSQRRAVSTMNYLVSKGIDSSRLTFEGLGESELVNDCGDNDICSEAEHQANRRSEFIVID